MAQQTTITFTDDLDGSEAAGTFDFSLDGRSYEIDLSDDNAARLRDALAPFVGAARKADGRGRRRAPRQTAVAEKPVRSNEETTAIRQWARQRASGQRAGPDPEGDSRGLPGRQLTPPDWLCPDESPG